MAFDSLFLSELKARNDIEGIIGGYLPLKRAGSRLNGLCPFHNEKTPSFTVFSDTASYYCFGCGAGGDVITFIMSIENLDYAQAVQLLAQKAGMNMPEESAYGIDFARRRERYYEMHKLAAKHYHECLMSDSGVKGYEYLSGRGITDNLIRRYGLGFAKDSFDDIKNFLIDKGFSMTEMGECGLLSRSRKNGGYYDRFRSRVIFPIIDIRGNIIAFSGRIVGEGGPKYLNSPETEIYKKGQTLYGLNLAKNNNGGVLLLAEGNLDVVALSQAGFKNAIAPLGTAFTKEQARIISKYADSVVIAFDSDDAGEKASAKAMDYLKELGINVKILKIEGAKDPDEYIKKYGRERFAMLIKGSRTPIEYKLERERGKYDLEDLAQKTQFGKAAVDIVAAITSPIEREIYAAWIADILGVDAVSVKNEAERRHKALRRSSVQQSVTKAQAELLGVQDRVNTQKARAVKAAKAEEMLIAILAKHPDILGYIKDKITPDEFVTDFYKEVFGFYMQRLSENSEIQSVAFSEQFSKEQAARIAQILNTQILTDNPRAQASDCIETIKSEKRRAVSAEKMNPLELARIIAEKNAKN